MLSNTISLRISWCGPCVQLEKLLNEKIGKREGRIKLIKINIETFPELANSFQIEVLPTMVTIKALNSLVRCNGAIGNKELDKFLDRIEKGEFDPKENKLNGEKS